MIQYCMTREHGGSNTFVIVFVFVLLATKYNTTAKKKELMGKKNKNVLQRQ